MKGFTLPVGLALYKVRFRKRVTLEGATCFGTCDFETKTITIDKSLNPDMMLQTYIHEALHANLHEMGEDVLNENEAFVDGLALGISKAVRAFPPPNKKPPEGG